MLKAEDSEGQAQGDKEAAESRETPAKILPDIDITEVPEAPLDDQPRFEHGEVLTMEGVPVLEDIMEEGEEEGEEVKQELIDKIRAAMDERDRLQSLNNQVQSEIAEYLARKKVPLPIYPDLAVDGVTFYRSG